MPNIKYPQYPNTRGWVSDDEWFEEELINMFPLSIASLGDDKSPASGNADNSNCMYRALLHRQPAITL
ncbi:hypothetical protein PG996_004696 [Apiospora saccharicola]|uniref:Uncharacterized protein n=1 Tax=Apiospora saccharicola TaxID=335842 RepID=A0ABR1W4T8_9PEZI